MQPVYQPPNAEWFVYSDPAMAIVVGSVGVICVLVVAFLILSRRGKSRI